MAFDGYAMTTTQVNFDMSDIEALASRLGVAIEQIPYGISIALNASMESARSYLIGSTWPGGVHVRNTSFMNASLTTRGNKASKRDLSVTLYDKLGRDYIVRQATGGTKTARTGNVAIPNAVNVRRGAHGVVRSQRPRALQNSFVKNGKIFQRQDKGLKLMYSLKNSVRVPKHVRMYEDGISVLEREMARALPAAFELAMSTARR